MQFSTLIKFGKLVSDSPTSESVSTILAQTVVEECGAAHALVFGTAEGNFEVLASYGKCGNDLRNLRLAGVDSLSELRITVIDMLAKGEYHFRTFPLISDSGLFGALGVLSLEAHPLREEDWYLIEGLTEFTAVSLNKTYQHQRLQKAFDDLRASQEVLVRTERFRALGQMSAGIAHDLKNLLNPLMLYADELRDVAGNRAETLEILKRVDRILNRGLETVERLRDFSRLSPEESEAVAVDLNAMVQESVEISKPKLASTQLVVELGTPLPVLVRPADCVTAIVNLIFNAVDAVQAKGKVTIRTGSADNGSWIEVADNGPGIPDEIRNKIFEPLFTTKGNQGTGLGVPIVQAFTQKYGGRLDIESAVGQGATFRMWFPAVRD